MTAAEILNFIVIFLLIAAIMYGFMLNKRISSIQHSKKELAGLFRGFDDTIVKAQVSIDELRHVSENIAQGLQKEIDRGAILLEDLMLATERASKTADGLTEKVLPSSKSLALSAPAKLDPESIKRIRNASAAAPSAPSSPTKEALSKEALAKRQETLQAILEKIAESRDASANENRPHTIPSSSRNEKIHQDLASTLRALGYGSE